MIYSLLAISVTAAFTALATLICLTTLYTSVGSARCALRKISWNVYSGSLESLSNLSSMFSGILFNWSFHSPRSHKYISE